MNQASLRIFEEKYDARALPFQSIQQEIIGKGKNLQFKSAKFVADCFSKSGIIFKNVEMQTIQPDPMDEKLKELMLYNENLEEKDQANQKEIDNLGITISKLIKEKGQLAAELQEFYDKEDLSQAKINKIAKFDQDLKFFTDLKNSKIEELEKALNKLQEELDEKLQLIRKLENDLEYERNINAQESNEVIAAAVSQDEKQKEEAADKPAANKPNKSRRAVVLQTDMTALMIERMLMLKGNPIIDGSQPAAFGGGLNPDESKFSINGGNSKEKNSNKYRQRLDAAGNYESQNDIGIQVQYDSHNESKIRIGFANEQISATDKFSIFERDGQKGDQNQQLKNKTKKKNWLKMNQNSSNFKNEIQGDIIDSDRRNIDRLKEYEHRFFRSSDNGKSVSPRVSMKKADINDVIQSNTAYYSRQMSPAVKKQKDFSPVLRRKTSNTVFDKIDLFQVFDRYKDSIDSSMKNYDKGGKEYVALTGKTIEFI